MHSSYTLDVELSEHILAQLDLEDAITQDFCQLSLNALSGTNSGQAMRVAALVKNKVMLILIDSGSSHSFVSSAFLQNVGLTVIPAVAKHVKLASGDTLITYKIVPGFEWWSNGHTLVTDMQVLDMQAYMMPYLAMIGLVLTAR